MSNKIKNRTSQVPVNRSIMHIEDCLVNHGAKNIIKTYENGKIEALCFSMMIDGKEIPFKLPAYVEACATTLRAAVKKPTTGTLERIADQAERTAWKIMSDWVDVQMTLIELQKVEFLRIFMPFIYLPKQKTTLYDHFMEKKILLTLEK